MATFNWNKTVSGDWNVAANWLENAIPNDLTADVSIPLAPAGSSGPYKITIAAGASDTVHSLDLNSDLEVDGTLTFAPGSTGALGYETGNSTLLMNGGKIVNAGLMFASIHTTGDVLFTGSNPIYIAWELQVVSGTATVDTASIGEYTGAQHLLFDGIFEALGAGRVINLGGKGGGLAVDVETLSGPKSVVTNNYWTQLIYDDPGSQINEWTGTSYVSIESTLKLIQNAAYVTVTGGRNYTTTGTLTIGKDGVFEQAGGTLSTGGLSVLSGGLLIGGDSLTGAHPSTGRVVVTGAVTNNGQIAAEGPGLAFRDAITGTGAITFNRTAALPGFNTPIGPAAPGTLEVGSVGAGQTVTMIGSDTLILDNSAGFAGTLSGFAATDTITVDSATAVTGITYLAGGNGLGTLTFNGGAAVLGSLTLAGNYAGASFTVAPGTVSGSYNVNVLASKATATDLSGSGKSDILWRDTSGTIADWAMNGGTITAGNVVGALDGDWKLLTAADLNSDGKADLLWQQTSTGAIYDWTMNGPTIAGSGYVGGLSSDWAFLGEGSLSGGGTADLLWQQKSTGSIVDWTMNGPGITSASVIGALGSDWKFLATADLNGDGKSDMLWQQTSTGSIVDWTMSGSSIIGANTVGALDSSWTFLAAADFNGDGKSDLLWQNTSGTIVDWSMNGASIAGGDVVGALDKSWSLRATGDYNGDGKADMAWQNTGGSIVDWQMNGPVIQAATVVGSLDSSWKSLA